MFKKHNLKELNTINVNGYKMAYYPTHPSATTNGCVYVHRLVMENHVDRFLKTNEAVHHKDHNRSNNNIDNLELKTRSKHSSEHALEQAKKKGLKLIKPKPCEVCGGKTKNKHYCSDKCYKLDREKIDWPPKEDLEKLVWETSTRQLAKQLGVSDNAIGKRCKKLGIQKPPRGYWAKRKSGKV